MRNGGVKSAKRTVYPCVYREHAIVFAYAHAQPGLSLCIQGTLSTQRQTVVLHRFIPVYTGNMCIINQHERKAAVYPCVYREHE